MHITKGTITNRAKERKTPAGGKPDVTFNNALQFFTIHSTQGEYPFLLQVNVTFLFSPMYGSHWLLTSLSNLIIKENKKLKEKYVSSNIFVLNC